MEWIDTCYSDRDMEAVVCKLEVPPSRGLSFAVGLELADGTRRWDFHHYHTAALLLQKSDYFAGNRDRSSLLGGHIPT